MSATRIKKNFTEGPLFFRITLFALPIMLTGMLQIFYGMADHIIVGRYSSDPNALAAVGCTGSLTSLIVNLLLGIGGGAGVVVAQCYGAKDDERVSKAVHTSLIFSLIGGIVFSALGLLVSRPVLTLMGTNPEIIDSATLYFRIICIGIPANAVYNFGAAILRSTGDSKTPLIILSSTGIVNVLLNLFFVIVCHMSVEGVAIATIASQYLSAVAVIIVLMLKKGESFGFSFSKLCFNKALFVAILKYGIPAGIQSSMFNFANVLLASAVNTFPTTTVTANTIAGSVDAITYIAMNSFAHASMTFVGQNYGALKKERIKKSIIYCVVQVLLVGSLVSGLELIFKEELVNLFMDSAAADKAIVTETVLPLITLLLTAYIICGVMDVVSGVLKGLGFALTPMIISMLCICGVRIFWIYVIFPMDSFHSITGLYTAYPVSWTLALIAMLITLVFAYKKIRLLKSNDGNTEGAEPAERALSAENK